MTEKHEHMGDEHERVRSHYYGDSCNPPHEEPIAKQVSEAELEMRRAASMLHIQELSNEFDDRCQKRHEMGEQKYGAGTWMNIDTLEMAIEEILDMANYIRFTYIKLRLIQEQFGADHSTASPQPGNEMMGKDAMAQGGFMSFRKDQ